ncbi:MAG: DUF481 domain-containing protein [Nitrospirae bacterium]|nr:MAG: DUF481 domain-containing protein [Nitrospirota bacterium]
MSVRIAAAACLCLLAAAPAAAEGGRWSATGSLAFLTASGNSRTQSGSVKLEASRAREGRDKITLKAGAILNRSDGEKTAESEEVSGQYDYFVSERTYALGSLLAERDAFAGYDYRITGRLGAGHHFVKDDHDLLDGELGFDYVYENKDPESEDFPAARAYGKWVHTFREGLAFTQDAELLENLDQVSDLRVNTFTGLEVALSAHLSLKTSLTVKYDAEPVPGSKTTDVYTETALVVSY